MEQSWLAIMLLASGTVLVLLVLIVFVTRRRYLRPPRPDRGVGFAQDKLAAEEKLSSLAPRLLQASEKEKSVNERIVSKPDDERHRKASRLLREADISGLWRSFVTASALIEDDPEMARETLESISTGTQTALDRLEEAEELVSAESSRER